MLTLVIVGTLLSALAGLVVKVTLDNTTLGDAGSITPVELAIGTALCALLVMPLVAGIGFKIARTDAVTFNEYWNGWEKAATVQTTTCVRDGSCHHTYDCDSYQVTEHYTVQVPYTTTESYSKPGGGTGFRTVTKYRTEDRTRQVTRWHSCPYVDTEYTYLVSDTLGQTHDMGDHWFPENPSAHRWAEWGFHTARWGNSLPNVSTGQPASWVAAKARLDAGTPGGVTAAHTYKNYILASQKDIYAKASSAIGSYKKAGLLPKPVTGTYDYYRADKVYFVGPTPGSAKDWQDSLLRFNGSFGSQRQGDLHLIVVTSPKITNPDEYANAVLAYWQSPALGKNALSKNGYVVVVGSKDGKTVDWARGFPGMPVGEERLNVDVRQDLTGTALTPEALLGTPQGKSINGRLGTLVFDKDHGFKRVEMKKFNYLFEQIQPSGGQKTVMVLIGFFFALLIWGVFIVVDVPLGPKTTRKPDSDRDFEDLSGRGPILTRNLHDRHNSDRYSRR